VTGGKEKKRIPKRKRINFPVIYHHVATRSEIKENGYKEKGTKEMRK